jgi:hypothetical protein
LENRNRKTTKSLKLLKVLPSKHGTNDFKDYLAVTAWGHDTIYDDNKRELENYRTTTRILFELRKYGMLGK